MQPRLTLVTLGVRDMALARRFYETLGFVASSASNDNVTFFQAGNHRLGKAAGGRLLKPGQKACWGGYSGYFADPDGHLWEVAHNPFFPMDGDGRLRLP